MKTAEQANEMFDGITYDKGAAVLRMFEVFLAPRSASRPGCAAISPRTRAGTPAEATSGQALAARPEQPVAELAESWFEQPGYPLVTVKRAGAALQLSQQRFVLNPRRRPGRRPSGRSRSA